MSPGALYWRALTRTILSRSGVPGCEERKSRKRASTPLLAGWRNSALRPIAVRKRTAPYGSKPARDAVRYWVVGQGRKFGVVVGGRGQAGRDVGLAMGKREGVDGGRIGVGAFVFRARPRGGAEGRVARLGDRASQPRVLIGPAIG